MKLPYRRRNFAPPRSSGPRGGIDPVTAQEAPAVRVAIRMLSAAGLSAGLLAGCSEGTRVAPARATLSAAMVEKNCNDPKWREQNLGLWYSVCRPPLRW